MRKIIDKILGNIRNCVLSLYRYNAQRYTQKWRKQQITKKF